MRSNMEATHCRGVAKTWAKEKLTEMSRLARLIARSRSREGSIVPRVTGMAERHATWIKKCASDLLIASPRVRHRYYGWAFYPRIEIRWKGREMHWCKVFFDRKLADPKIAADYQAEMIEIDQLCRTIHEHVTPTQPFLFHKPSTACAKLYIRMLEKHANRFWWVHPNFRPGTRIRIQGHQQRNTPGCLVATLVPDSDPESE